MTSADSTHAGALLIIEEVAEAREALGRLLWRTCRVLSARTIEEARSLLDLNHGIQVILTGAHGALSAHLGFFKSLKRTHPEIVRLMVVDWSAQEEAIEATRQGHVHRYLSKPWHPMELRLAVEQAFAQYASQRELLLARRQLERAEEELVSQRARLAEAERELGTLDRLRAAFMQVVSHELNTPIAVLNGYIYLLRRELGEDASSVVSRSLERIESSSRRLRRISDRTLQMLTSQQPEVQLDTRRVDLREFASALHLHVEPLLRARHQRLICTIESDAREVEADPEKFQDIFLNLVMNAIKFSPDGETITLRTFSCPQDPDQMLVISVEDHGVGIRDEDLPRIFDAFFGTFETSHHSSGEYEFNKRGIGLGLTIVRRFTELHGGHVHVENRAGGGTGFYVCLPRRQG